MQIPAERIERHLSSLGCAVARDDGTLLVTPPPWRRDLSIAADLVEEVARIEGYDQIPAIVPSVAPHEISSAEYERENEIGNVLQGLGYREIITQSLRNEGTVEVRNPLSEEQRFLRESLLPGALEYFAEAASPVRVFEVGETFTNEDPIAERSMLAFGFSADPIEEPAWRDSEFLRLKGDCERLLRRVTGRIPDVARGTRAGFHPGKTAVLSLDGREAGYLGKIDPRLAKRSDLRRNAYLCIVDIRALPSYETPSYSPPSRFPSTYRDLALIVGVDVAAGAIEKAVSTELRSICTNVRVFDEYRGPQIG
ncbi:MAG TPA: hypothetical protein VGI15_04005, partial [Candidatus Cybelea sp.]